MINILNDNIIHIVMELTKEKEMLSNKFKEALMCLIIFWNRLKGEKIFVILPLAICIILGAFSGCTHDKIEISSEEVISPINTMKPVLRVYIENSGSMDGYMSNGAQLKDAIFDYVSDLNGYTEKTELYYINSKTIPFVGNVEHYVKTMTPATFKKAGGNLSNSDIGTMIGTVLNNMNDSTVCMFISDCILDLPAADAQKFLNNCRISIKNAINEGRKRIPNLGVEVLKMTSDFNGKYFYQNGLVENLIDVKRPYYIWIFGDSNVLANLNSEVPFSGLKKYGFEDLVSFTKKVNVPYDIKNKAITSPVINPIKGNYIATIRADFRATLHPEIEIQNPSNYSFNNPSLLIETIQPITAKDSYYTHFITIVIPKGVKIAQDNLIFNAPKIPNWVSESNDETGQDIKSNLTKTTGIKHIIEGVADSYKKDNISTNFKFTIKRI